MYNFTILAIISSFFKLSPIYFTVSYKSPFSRSLRGPTIPVSHPSFRNLVSASTEKESANLLQSNEEAAPLTMGDQPSGERNRMRNSLQRFFSQMQAGTTSNGDSLAPASGQVSVGSSDESYDLFPTYTPYISASKCFGNIFR